MAKLDKNGNSEFREEELTPPESVDYFIYRTDVAREHKHANYWMIAFFVMLAIATVTNLYWVWNEMQYEEISVSQDIDTGEGDAYVAGVGDVNYGTGETDNQGQETQNWR